MANRRPTAGAVYAALLEAITDQPTGWPRIRDHISARFKITNWLTQVRGPLQFGLDEGRFRRLPGLQREEYIRNAKP